MQTDKYGSICLEDFSEASMEITLVHVGKENCRPYHGVSAARTEYILHFVLSGEGFYSANGNTWHLGPGEMFLIHPGEPVVYCADVNNPWSYIWIGFKGVRVDTILKNCGFSKSRLTLPAPAPAEYMDTFDELFEHKTLSFSDDLYRESILLRLFAILTDFHARNTPPNDNLGQTGYSDNIYVNLAVDYQQNVHAGHRRIRHR